MIDYDKAYELFADIRLGIAEDSDLLEFLYEVEKTAYQEGYAAAKEFYISLIKE